MPRPEINQSDIDNQRELRAMLALLQEQDATCYQRPNGNLMYELCMSAEDGRRFVVNLVISRAEEDTGSSLGEYQLHVEIPERKKDCEG